MRIVSGQLKGIRFSPPKSFSARPTTDFAKENLFNVLGNRIDFEDQKVLDLFGGTGSISYEFASRGCQHITCIEKNFKHYKFISDTVKKLKLDTQIRPFKYCSFKYLEKCDETFDIIFADPPFDLKTLDNLPDLVFSRPILSENGFFILEHSDKKSFSNHPHFFEVRKYGKVHFSLFK
ncbi:16S rRNA (guanine(966)-N(2))-methyltransferase RsmD [Marinilabiliaceae bacterium JC017]|nr:16S rRNA (guanine(966)-N(2))-methyltransferase RsmD [Marinilabiliaceae bacterium JC017]